MKKLKIIIIVVSLIIVAIIIALLIYNTNQYYEEEHGEVITEDMVEETQAEREYTQNEEQFFTIEKLASNYYLYARLGNADAVVDILTDNFKNNNGITAENVIQRLGIEKEGYRAREILTDNSSSNTIYLVYGVIGEREDLTESYLIVYVDIENSTYAIQPIEEEMYINYKNENTVIEQIEQIEKKEYNTYRKTTVTEESAITRYFEDFVKEMVYDPEYAYEKIDETYKQAKFGEINQFLEYIENRDLQELLPDAMRTQEEFSTEEEYLNYLYNYEVKGINQYQVTREEQYTQYVIIDDNGNYYIFRATSPMSYTVILDTYTIDLPEFTEQYNSASEEQKVQLNIQRFFAAINDGDYEYAYNKLDETYRNNNFVTEADFENYVKNNFFEKNSLGYSSYEKNNDLYIYSLTIKNEENEAETIERQFVIKLLEGTDFVASFSI